MAERIRLWEGEAPYTADSPDQPQPSLTAFPAEGARGAIIVCPGGGYCMKADHEGAPIARMLNSQGIAAFVLDYRVMPCHRLAPWTDAARVHLAHGGGRLRAGAEQPGAGQSAGRPWRIL